MNSMSAGPGCARTVLRAGRSGVAGVGSVALMVGFSGLEFEIRLIAKQDVRRDDDFWRH